MRKQVLIPILVLSILGVAIYLALTQIPQSGLPPTAAPTGAPSTVPTNVPTQVATQGPIPTINTNEYLLIFEEVWSTVNATYFDPDFGGLDWDAIYDKYEPLISAAADDNELYWHLNQMLWELNVSHIGVGPADMWPSTEPVVWEEGAIGIDVRLLDHQGGHHPA